MHKTHKQISFRSRRPLYAAALFLFLFCLVTLSACSGDTAVQKPPKPTPTIETSLQSEGNTQLQAFWRWISIMQQYQGDFTIYEQQYHTDELALQAAKTDAAYQKALQQLKAHIAAIQMPALKTEDTYLLQELQQEAVQFGQLHTYHDAYNNTTYPLGYEYGPFGATSSIWLHGELAADQTVADYQQTVEDIQMDLTNFQAMTKNFTDKTPYYKVHQTDIQLLQYYGYMQSRVVIVSLSEQAIRIYQNGQLLKAFQVTTGQPDLPTPPGTWWVEGKKHPTEFKADVPQSSPNWYPPTPINYAMQFHSNGYFLHDSWWRSEYGPGTNFPHLDPGGTQYSIHGSHGCVNMALSNAAWLYGFVQLYTHVLIY